VAGEASDCDIAFPSCSGALFGSAALAKTGFPIRPPSLRPFDGNGDGVAGSGVKIRYRFAGLDISAA